MRVPFFDPATTPPGSVCALGESEFVQVGSRDQRQESRTRDFGRNLTRRGEGTVAWRAEKRGRGARGGRECVAARCNQPPAANHSVLTGRPTLTECRHDTAPRNPSVPTSRPSRILRLTLGRVRAGFLADVCRKPRLCRDDAPGCGSLEHPHQAGGASALCCDPKST